MNCMNCYAEVPLDAGFCSSCGHPVLDGPVRIPASRNILFVIAMTGSIAVLFFVYIIMFDDFSESELILLVPAVVVMGVFGITGRLAEDIWSYAATHEISWFSKAGIAYMQSDEGNSLWKIFQRFYGFPYTLFKHIQPLSFALVCAGIWGFFLFLFIVGIFPSL